TSRNALAILFRRETQAFSDEVIKNADAFIKIPMYGITESLNISVSAAIIINHITTRLRNSTIDWKLTNEELLMKKIDWTRKSIKDIDTITKRYLAEIDK